MYRTEVSALSGIIINKKYYYNEDGSKRFIIGQIIDQNGNLIKSLSCEFDCTPLCFRCFLISENNNMITTLLDASNDEPVINEFVCYPGSPNYIISDYLLLHDLIIIKMLNNYFLYNYFTKQVLSSGYSSMEEVLGHIYVTRELKEDTLVGEIDLQGNLLDNMMTLRKINTEVRVNPKDMLGSMSKISSRYPRLVRKMKKQNYNKALLDYEYEVYLANKKKNQK